jgi:hypothetical protein
MTKHTLTARYVPLVFIFHFQFSIIHSRSARSPLDKPNEPW